jgi:hypothetical protein
MTAAPITTGYRRISGGDFQVTVSIRAGTRIHLQVPASVFDAGALTELIGHVVNHVQEPRRAGPDPTE